MKRNTDANKTQCQLCKRLAGPIFPLSWSRMFWERVSTMDLIAKGQSRKNHFPENWAISGMVTNNRALRCPWISKCKTSGVPFDDSRALLHCWGLGNSIGITKESCTYYVITFGGPKRPPPMYYCNFVGIPPYVIL